MLKKILRKKIIIKSMIGHSLSMHKIRGKTKIDTDTTSIGVGFEVFTAVDLKSIED
jgi:ribosomal protein S19